MVGLTKWIASGKLDDVPIHKNNGRFSDELTIQNNSISW